MILPLVLASLVASSPVRCEQPANASRGSVWLVPDAPHESVWLVPDAARDSTLLTLYESGQDFETFLREARARREMWDRNWADGQVSPELLERARAIPGRWRLLVAAVDGCSDSVNTVPYLARLVSLVPSLEMRIVKPDAGAVFMERHRTPDGRSATPTVVILDAAGNDVGCWVERPAALQEMAMRARADETYEDFARNKQSWYDADAGASTVREVLDVIEAAALGAPVCHAADGTQE